MLIARLIADADALDTRLDKASEALAAQGTPVAMAAMLDFCSDVLQIALPDGDPRAVRDTLTAHFGPCDILVADHEIEVPRLFVSDMDSTIIGQECIDELADYAGIKDRIAATTERAMAGELDFEAALRERVGLLAGLSDETVAQCLAERIRPAEGARTLVQTLKAKGCRTVLVTGGFHHFADAVAEQLGFDRTVANRLAVRDGALTGGLVGRISDAATKRATLEEERAALGERARVLAAGDGANDVPMISAADYGFACHAKPVLKAEANGRVESTSLTAILSLLGIPRTEWVDR